MPPLMVPPVMPAFTRVLRTRLAARLLCAAAACATALACTTDTTSRAADTTAVGRSAEVVNLTGAGATFPYPLYARWFNEYARLRNVRINYQSIGSGGGIRQVVARTVDFGATDVPMTDTERADARVRVLHIPMAIGAVAVTYNLPSLTRPLQLDGTVLADIFLGRVTRWNDPRIAALNPRVALPDAAILVVHRADGSGTSFIFSDFLAAVSPAWASGPGRGKDVRWPVGIGGKGNEGVAGQVKQMPGALGYVEVVYARQNRLPVVHLQNRAGRFVSPMPFEIASAAAAVLESALDAPATPGAAPTDSSLRAVAELADLRLSLVNAPGPQSYPIASFTWMLLAPDAVGPVKTRQIAQFLRWALLDGSDIASSLGYVPLPSDAAARVVDRLDRLVPPDDMP